MSKSSKQKRCSVCGDTESIAYYIWQRQGEFYLKELCNKHYNQLIRHGYLLDKEQSTHQKRHKWTKEEEEQLKSLYAIGLSMCDIGKEMGLSVKSVRAKSCSLKLGDKYMRSNNVKFKAVYQDYDWCYQRYIVQGMTHQEMANECGASLRVIQKWCSQIHRLNKWSFKEYKQLSDLQYQIILFGTLGDGHIDKREDQPLYIESHAIDETDYVFWKYDKLKDLCSAPPKYYEATYTSFGTNKQYLCKPYYRFETRIINQLKEIRDMPRIQKIQKLNELGLCLHVLDDGSRGNTWYLCLAEYSQEEIDLYIRLCKERLNLICWRQKDERYLTFDAPSSRKIDKMILNIFPENFDIIQKKIINNSNVTPPARYVYIVLNDGNKIGLNNYCRSHQIPYVKTKKIIDKYDLSEIKEDELLQMIQEEEIS